MEILGDISFAFYASLMVKTPQKKMKAQYRVNVLVGMLMQNTNLIQLWKRYETFIRYAIVGAGGTLVDLGTLAVLTEGSGIDPANSILFPVFVTIAFCAAVLFNYVLNRLWTFKSNDKNVSAQFFRFAVVSVGGFVLTQALMWLMVSGLGIWYLFSKAFTSMAVLIWNFSLNKLWTFRAPSSTVLS